MTTDFKNAGDLSYVVDRTHGELGGTRFERVVGRKLGSAPRLHLGEALRCYRRLACAIRKGFVRSCHDLSDGGLWVALAESAFGGDCGFRVFLDDLPVARDCLGEPARLLFCETPSRFVASVTPQAERKWLRVMKGSDCARIGEVTEDRVLRVLQAGQEIASVPLHEARRAWQGEAKT
jgi:phosphoribosylformylglycinamidine synthase